jgi:hypothetical protein
MSQPYGPPLLVTGIPLPFFTWWCEEEHESYDSQRAARDSGPTPPEKEVRSIAATPVSSVVFIFEQNLR